MCITRVIFLVRLALHPARSEELFSEVASSAGAMLRLNSVK